MYLLLYIALGHNWKVGRIAKSLLKGLKCKRQANASLHSKMYVIGL